MPFPRSRRVEQTVSTWGRQCLPTTGHNSFDPQLNRRGTRVNGEAYVGKTSYSCILEALGPTGVLRTPGGGARDGGGGGGRDRT